MRPYPWQSLPRISRDDARATQTLAGLLDVEPIERAERALAALLEIEVSVSPGPIGSIGGEALSAHLNATLVAVALERQGARLAVELEPGASLAAIDRVLGGEGSSGVGPLLLSPIEQGVLAFVAARACEGTGVAVADVLTTREGLGAWLGEGAVAWRAFTVELGAQTSSARLWAPMRSLGRLASAPRPLPESLGDVGVTLRMRVGRARVSSSELASLAPGDVLLPDELRAERSETGPRWSEAALSARGGVVVVELAREGDAWKIVSTSGSRGARSAKIVEGAMSEGEAMNVRTDELSEVADVPVELSIELGRIELRVRELAALVPGRVISARLPVGGEVELRAGDRVVARGELVDIEGELGVRILSRG